MTRISLNTPLEMFSKVRKHIFERPTVNFIYFFSDSCFYSSTVAGAVLNILSLKCPHKWKSKGDKSGLDGGHKAVAIDRSVKDDWKICMVSNVVRGRALSYWKYTLTSLYLRRAMKSVMIHLYVSTVMIESKTIWHTIRPFSVDENSIPGTCEGLRMLIL